MKPIKALYIYDKDTGTLNQILGCHRTNLTFRENTPQEGVHFYAENPTKHFRIEISERPGEVFEDKYKNSLVVWFHEVNRDKAIEVVGIYILESIGTEIRTHESFIRRLQKDRAKAYKLLKSLPEI